MKPLFLAGCHQEAVYWAEQLGFTRGEWVYLSAHNTHGRHEPTVYAVGTWQERYDLPAIWATLMPCNPTVIFAEEMVP